MIREFYEAKDDAYGEVSTAMVILKTQKFYWANNITQTTSIQTVYIVASTGQ